MNKRPLVMLLAAMTSLLSPALALAVENGGVKLANTQLILLQKEQVCYIKQQNSPAPAQSLKLAWPCQFHKKKDGNLRVVKRGKYEYLMVESTKQIANSRDCDTEMRAIRARADKWAISEHCNKVASCPPFQWDAMVFSELFDNP